MNSTSVPNTRDKSTENARYHTLSILELAGQDIELKRVASTHGGEYHGPCPGCGGEDRFIIWPATGRYWCRQCDRKGDAIQFLRDFHGYSFPDAARIAGKDLRPPLPAQQAHRRALEAARHAYQSWARDKLIALTDWHRELLQEQVTARTALRLAQNRPNLLTLQEIHYWEGQLGQCCDQLAALEHELDILTYREHEAERLQMWKEATTHA